jgi:fused signal recognition particle receptor
VLQFLKSSYQKVKQALKKTRSALGQRLQHLFSSPLNEETFDRLEQILYEADLGSSLASDFVKETRHMLKQNSETPFKEIIETLSAHSLKILSSPPRTLPKLPKTGEPLVILIVGVNGSGKTTTLAKLARHYQQEGKKVLLAAGDTFRAAAIEQLGTWATRLNLDIVKSQPQADPSAVVFDALTAAKARGIDVVLIDTAGRLQNKTDLMQELEKIKRICHKLIPDSPHETLLILDATTGQNAVDQAKTFDQFTPLTGIILTKLDGSAKGGIVISVYKELKVPIRWIGVGEQAEDLMAFNAEEYVSALFEL